MWAIRGQETLLRWDFDPNGGIQGMVQQPPPDFQIRTVPIERSLLFRTRTNKNNPEGKSLLRSAYRSWFFKKRIEEIEGIGIERDLAGLPVLIPPEGVDLWNTSDATAATSKTDAETLVRSIRRDEQEGVLIPFGWELKLLTTGGRRQFDTTEIINRYDQRILMTVMADFLLLGSKQVGSFALASSKTSLFAAALGGYLDSVSGVVNQHAIPSLLALNGMRPEKKPVLTHGDIESVDLEVLGEYVQRLSGSGMELFPSKDGKVERYLSEQAGIPTEVADMEG